MSPNTCAYVFVNTFTITVKHFRFEYHLISLVPILYLLQFLFFLNENFGILTMKGSYNNCHEYRPNFEALVTVAFLFGSMRLIISSNYDVVFRCTIYIFCNHVMIVCRVFSLGFASPIREVFVAVVVL